MSLLRIGGSVTARVKSPVWRLPVWATLSQRHLGATHFWLFHFANAQKKAVLAQSPGWPMCSGCPGGQNQSKSPGQMASYSTITSKSQDWRPHILILSQQVRIFTNFWHRKFSWVRTGASSKASPPCKNTASRSLNWKPQEMWRPRMAKVPQWAPAPYQALSWARRYSAWACEGRVNFCLQSQLSEQLLTSASGSPWCSTYLQRRTSECKEHERTRFPTMFWWTQTAHDKCNMLSSKASPVGPRCA